MYGEDDNPFDVKGERMIGEARWPFLKEIYLPGHHKSNDTVRIVSLCNFTQLTNIVMMNRNRHLEEKVLPKSNCIYLSKLST